MKCATDKCEGTLRVTHTYTVSVKKYQRAVCEQCKTVWRLDTVAVKPVQGQGARAMANKERKL